MRALTRGAVAATALLVLASTATAAGPAVAITSPAAGSTVSRAAGPITVSGTYETVTPEAEDRTFYLRRSACANGNDDARLSLEKGGSTEINGCGFIAQPANEVLIAEDGEGLSTEYAAADGLPLTLDATRPVNGSVRVSAGVGVVTVELELRGTVAGTEQVLAASTTTFNGTLGTRDIPLKGNVDPKLDKKDVTAMVLKVRVRGVNVQSGGIDNRNGVSKIDIPSYTASFAAPVVDVAASSTFAGLVKASLKPDGTWTATLPAPAVGAREIHARLVQGPTRTLAAPVAITVTP
jgi:hypothetical protein